MQLCHVNPMLQVYRQQRTLLVHQRQALAIFQGKHETRRLVAWAGKGGKKSNISAEQRLRNAGMPDSQLTQAPALSEEDMCEGDPIATTSSTSSAALQFEPDTNQALKVLWKRVLKEVASLPRAIAIMFIITGLSGLGTVIPQNKPLEYYIENYPDHGAKVMGFLTYDWIYALQLNHIYTAWYFYLSLGLLAASLMACTATRQWPTVKVAQRWRFPTKPQTLVKMGKTEVLPNARLPDLGKVLMSRGYQVFLKDSSLYAFKGLAGRLGPIGVHAALLLILGGTAYSGIGGLKGTAMCPEGQEFVVSNRLYPASPLATIPRSAETILHVNQFSIDYRPDGSVAQFFSDLSLRDFNGREVLRKKISVNDPLRYGGVTMYQTDWSLASVTVRVLDASSSNLAFSEKEAFNLPLASLEGRPGISGRLWGSFLPIAAPEREGMAPRGVSILARDLQSVIFYDSTGKFVGVRRPGSNNPIEVEGVKVIVDAVTGSTGLELKSDPGVPWVYAGFGGLMVTTLVSYLSHSQVWALKDGKYVYVTGRSNRAVITFNQELDAMLEEVPELPDAQDEVPEPATATAAAQR